MKKKLPSGAGGGSCQQRRSDAAQPHFAPEERVGARAIAVARPRTDDTRERHRAAQAHHLAGLFTDDATHLALYAVVLAAVLRHLRLEGQAAVAAGEVEGRFDLG